jgi:hypothetical protein
VRGNFIRYVLAWSLALVLLYRGGNAISQSLGARAWPITAGVVHESDARWIAGHYRLAAPIWSYQLHLRYAYRVAGKEYIGTRASFGGWGEVELNNPFAAALAHALPVGAVVPVHYDPRDPTRSVLEPRARASAWIALLAGIGLAMVGRRYWRRALAESRASASVEAVVSDRPT